MGPTRTHSRHASAGPDPAADFDSVVDAVLHAALDALKQTDPARPGAIERALADVVTACSGKPAMRRFGAQAAARMHLATKMSAMDARRYVALAFGDDPPPAGATSTTTRKA